jgi:hypothetical protein
LKQNCKKIIGSHSLAIPGCARINEGGASTVKGIVIHRTAVLIVTSERNGDIVMGTASLYGNRLFWKTNEIIKQSEPEGDSPLILNEGLLTRAH